MCCWSNHLVDTIPDRFEFLTDRTDVYERRDRIRTQRISSKPSTLVDSVCDVNGGFVADSSAKVERWHEHFQHHPNFDTKLTTSLLSSTAEFPPSPTVSCDSPSEEVVVDAIPKLRNNKAPGEDGIPAEIYKSSVKTGGLDP
ncbi:hypothetical protein SprV_0401560400 [Sparganum proliferum]